MDPPPMTISDEGFTILHDPDEPTAEYVFNNKLEGEQQIMLTLASIIIVHGLGGNPYKTWVSQAPDRPQRNPPGHASRPSTPNMLSRIFIKLSCSHTSGDEEDEAAQAESNTGLHWPRDLLPRDCAESRILVWGYDSHITKGYSACNKSNLFGHAKTLLYSLRRDKPPRRPIIFVAHSLGGLIVKEVSPPQPIYRVYSNSYLRYFAARRPPRSLRSKTLSNPRLESSSLVHHIVEVPILRALARS
jgi:hypothetical protein